MAIKLITTADTTWEEMPISLFRPYSRGIEMPKGVKVASSIEEQLEDLQVDANHTLVHTLAVGSTERYGPNRNGDGFRRSQNKLAHQRFVTNGNVYKHHKNKDPTKACGSIKLSAYNDSMDRIELVIALRNDLCSDEIQKLASGKDVPGSMGCHIQYDVCSICQHQAPTPKSYCEHAKYALGKVLDDGRQVYVDNPDPHYFDWSLVGRPADRIAYGRMLKVAAFEQPLVFSTELADHAGLCLPLHMVGSVRRQSKLAVLRKLSAMEKEVSGNLTAVDSAVASSNSCGCMDDSAMSALKSEPLPCAMNALHSAKVILSPQDFLRLLTDDELAADLAEDLQAQLPDIFAQVEEDPDAVVDFNKFDGEGQPSPCAAKAVEKVSQAFGLGEEPLGQRVAQTIMRGSPSLTKVAKVASDNQQVQGLALAYAAYKLAALTHPAIHGDLAIARTTLLAHTYRGK